MQPGFRPLIWYLVVSMANETISSLTAFLLHNTDFRIPFTNSYLLIYPMLLVAQFRNFKLFVGKNLLYYGVQTLLVVGWILLLFVLGGMKQTGNWFRITNYIVLVLLALSNINRIFSRNTTDLLHNTNFVFTAACLIHYIPRFIVDVFYMWGLDKDISFIIQVYVILIASNTTFYIILAYGLLWTDRKQPYLLLY